MLMYIPFQQWKLLYYKCDLTFTGYRSVDTVLLHVGRRENGFEETVLSPKGEDSIKKIAEQKPNYHEGII